MSNLAKSDDGEVKTASEFRDEYMISGVKYEDFRCPFCNVRLVAKAIYMDKVQIRSPHFGLFQHQLHAEGCDGYPIKGNKSLKVVSKRHTVTIGSEVFEFPEKLTNRKISTNNSHSNVLDNKLSSATASSIIQKRKAVGLKGESHKYTSSLLQSFVKSRDRVLIALYEASKEKGMSQESQNNFISQTLREIPLELGSYRLNYNTGFQITSFFTGFSRIWLGEGKVQIDDKQIRIISSKPMQIGKSKTEPKVEFQVVVPLCLFAISNLKYHLSIKDDLYASKVIKWYCYGTAKHDIQQNLVTLTLSNLDHIYLKKVGKNRF